MTWREPARLRVVMPVALRRDWKKALGDQRRAGRWPRRGRGWDARGIVRAGWPAREIGWAFRGVRRVVRRKGRRRGRAR